MLTADPIVSASPNQVSGVLEGETILLSSTTNIYYGLDAVGSRVWELIQEPKRLSEISAQLLADFEVDPLVCESDLRELIARLLDADLINVQD